MINPTRLTAAIIHNSDGPFLIAALRTAACPWDAHQVAAVEALVGYNNGDLLERVSVRRFLAVDPHDGTLYVQWRHLAEQLAADESDLFWLPSTGLHALRFAVALAGHAPMPELHRAVNSWDRSNAAQMLRAFAIAVCADTTDPDQRVRLNQRDQQINHLRSLCELSSGAAPWGAAAYARLVEDEPMIGPDPLAEQITTIGATILTKVAEVLHLDEDAARRLPDEWANRVGPELRKAIGATGTYASPPLLAIAVADVLRVLDAPVVHVQPTPPVDPPPPARVDAEALVEALVDGLDTHGQDGATVDELVAWLAAARNIRTTNLSVIAALGMAAGGPSDPVRQPEPHGRYYHRQHAPARPETVYRVRMHLACAGDAGASMAELTDAMIPSFLDERDAGEIGAALRVIEQDGHLRTEPGTDRFWFVAPTDSDDVDPWAEGTGL